MAIIRGSEVQRSKTIFPMAATTHTTKMMIPVTPTKATASRSRVGDDVRAVAGAGGMDKDDDDDETDDRGLGSEVPKAGCALMGVFSVD